MPKFEDIIKQEAGVADEELGEEQEEEISSELVTLEAEKHFDRRKFKHITKKDAVSDKGKEAFFEMQRRVELDKSDISEDPLIVKEVEKIIETLPTEREKEVIRQFYFQGKNLTEIGDALGLSPSRIKQIERKALRQLRYHDRMKQLEGIELSSRDRDRYHNILGKILYGYIYDPRVEKNKKIQRALRSISIYTWGPEKKYLCELDSLVFNQICDEIKSIGGKEIFNDQDVADLDEIRKRLEQEIEKVKGEG